VPPRLYGGTERVVSYLTEDLVRQGHAVTLFASGDSATAAKLISVCDRAIRLDPAHPDPYALHAVMLERVCRYASSFDVIHFHTDGLHLPVARRCPRVCSVTTLHGRLDTPGLAALYDEFGEQPLISVSDAQRGPLNGANWIATVYHGLPRQIHAVTETPGRYLAFLGRIAPEKGIERAVDARLNRIVIQHPHLPEGLDRLSIRNLQVGQATADLIVQRYSGTVGLNVERPSGNVEVLLLN